MKVLLINPTWKSVYGNFVAAAEVAVLHPPLGLCYLASALEKHGHEVKIIDSEAIDSMEELDNIIKSWNPQLIGFTCTLPQINETIRLAQHIKNISNAVLAIGGPHITVLNRDPFIKSSIFDYGVIGEGEETFPELVNAIEQNKEIRDIRGIIYKNKAGEIVKTEPRSINNYLDKLPFPNRKLLDLDRYRMSVVGKGLVRISTIMSTRGCPFKCLYCPETALFPSFRVRSKENVCDEIEECTALGIKHFYFVDLTMTANKKVVAELCNEIIRRNIRITWECHTRVDCVDKDILSLMKKAGLVRVSYGVETGDEEILKKINKEVSFQQIKDAFRISKGLGLETRASAIIGHPGETKKTVMKTLRFMRRLKNCDQLYLYINVPYPGTPLYEMAKKGENGLKLISEDYSKYIRYSTPVIEVNNLKRKDIINYQRLGFLIFYFTPRRIWYNLTRAGLKAGIRNSIAFFNSVVLGRKKKSGVFQSRA
ncbi:hypothetical protein CMO89_04240 [Candidatus Woesearchaeota archaeon]|nr:hypothetical protein [Candidatus Woesearchaeota archaeon]|tara:strand:- start:15879 stop:17324 length:1446 start_codon:yes stop_codon:yes gene_type:complete